ncbi:MAG: amino acid permease [Actinomycetota bacterium]|nr:amino acid permease [Actinomycetota bacterium]
MKTEPDLKGEPGSPGTSEPQSCLKDPPSAALPRVDLPESLRYRIKNRLLGPPLHTAELENERLGIPTALAVFSSDCISSSAYATEEILRVLIPAAGLFAFSLVLPITTAMLVVLFFLILSYRETIKEYPTAGGAYMVTRDNFGLLPAQVAGTSLLTDYVLTVAVSTAAGTAALTSAFSVLTPFTLPISIFFVILLAFVNLKGVKESGKIFAAPTYLFIIVMGVLLLVGAVKALGGNLHPQHIESLKGVVAIKGNALGQGLFYGAGLYVVLHAFASGGAAVTGVEAISNGVTAFRKPEWKNARVTLIIMGLTLGTLFFGLSALSTKIHPIPYESGSPTVISQIGKFVFGGGLVGSGLFYVLQAGTMLILVLAANTSFADFPRLASFHAGDNFMPKQLTTRGHRLVFSNGIVSLAAAAVVLLIATGAKVDRLIPLYAIGVFTSFTMSQAGMAKHHLTHKQPGWRKGLFVNATGAVLSLIVDAIILVTKFTHGAWVIVLIVPIMVAGLVRLNRQYEAETEELESDAPAAAAAPILRRHHVLVLVDSLDVASARAIQYARTLTPDQLRVLHFDLDPDKTHYLREEWTRLGLTRLPLDVVECPDRRITRATAEAVAGELASGDTEVSVLIPRRRYRRVWHQLLHDRTAESIAGALGGLAHCNVTIVPYVLGSGSRAGAEQARDAATVLTSRGNGARGTATPSAVLDDSSTADVPAGCIPITEVRYRHHVRVGGRVHAQRVRPWAGVGTLECTVVDGTGAVTIVFMGRRQIPGIHLGSRISVEGTAGQHDGRLAILNPKYSLLGDDS